MSPIVIANQIVRKDFAKGRSKITELIWRTNRYRKIVMILKQFFHLFKAHIIYFYIVWIIVFRIIICENKKIYARISPT